MHNKKFFFIMLLVLPTLLIISCKNSNNTIPDFCYGLISSSEQQSDSKFIYLDSDLEIVDNANYNFASIGGCQYYSPYILNNILYEISLGEGINKDNCAVIGLDLNAGVMTEYSFKNRVNITDYVVTDDYIYTVSNLNKKTYIDRYSFNTQKIETYIMENLIGIDLCLCKDQLYVFVDDINSYAMYSVDISNQKSTIAYDLTEYCLEDNKPSYYATYQDDIYLPCNEFLLHISTIDGTVTKIPLPCNNAFGTYTVNNILYLSCTDIFNADYKASIISYDMESQKIQQTYNLQSSIEQFIVDKNTIIVLGLDDTVYKYEINENSTCNLLAQNQITHSDDYYLTSLFKNFNK